MSNQRKYIVVKNDYHPGKMFGSAPAHKIHLNMPYIKVYSFLLERACIKNSATGFSLG
ncbi:hypothetical protein HDC90_005175 [Pedobacter sp. AK013]|nr:hypothetical protein [Pedobacter sp. AK013]